ncbi:MAG: hypothetical protein PHH49_03570 [Candidatus Omnitrophica bacterium]|nr:hypothetical protein [Candidatus Omnitrophota bacterium]MDD5488028.1 hypothetical protein [Candidatus Omnitrophota bacterium]
MKRFLQACEMGGSIYGKKKTSKNNTPRKGTKYNKTDAMTEYDRLYRYQISAMERIFKRDK